MYDIKSDRGIELIETYPSYKHARHKGITTIRLKPWLIAIEQAIIP